MKINEVRKYLARERLDALVLFNKSPNFNYFLSQNYEHGILLLTKKQNIIFLSPLYSPKMPGFKVVHWKNFKKDFESFIKKNKIKRVGADYNNLFFRQKRFLSKHFKTSDSSKLFDSLRVIKTKDEVKNLREACRITDEIFKSIVLGLKNKRFQTEKDIAKHMKIMMLEAGCEPSFEPIVASGGNGVIAHHEPNARLKKGFMVLDFGAKYKGYCADMTRTICLGSPSEKERVIYEKLLAIQKSCVEYAKPGIKASVLFRRATKLMGEDAKYFIHGLGHGIGVEIHELPSLFLKSKEVLQAGNVFTIEPGYYNTKTGIGIRIEDDIYLGRDGKKEVLTKSAKGLISIKI
jgi:Xaa-Pro aminopeptidase